MPDLSPMNARMARAYDSIAAEFAARNAAMPPALTELGLRFLAALGPGARVLDLGCGPGRDMAWLEEHGATVTGVDLSPGMLAQARPRVRGALLCMDMRALDFPDSSFQGVWSMAALLHLPKRDVPAALAEMCRVLVPGGLLHLSLQEGQGQGWEPSDYTAAAEPVERFFARYTEAEARALLLAAGFHVLESSGNTSGPRRWLQFLATPAQNR